MNEQVQQDHEATALVYDPTASIVIRTGSLYNDTELKAMDAFAVSCLHRDNAANARKMSDYQTRIANARTWFIENADDYGDEDWFTDLAELLGISLTKTVEVTVEVTYTNRIEVPINFDAENLDSSDFSISVEYDGEGETVGYDDYDVTVSVH